MLGERDRAEGARCVREPDSLAEDVLDIGVIEARAEDLPELHAGSRAGVDHRTACMTALVDHNPDAFELRAELARRVEQAELGEAGERVDDVGQPRLLVALLGEKQRLDRALLHRRVLLQGSEREHSGLPASRGHDGAKRYKSSA